MVSVFLQPIWGILGDRHGRKPTGGEGHAESGGRRLSDGLRPERSTAFDSPILSGKPGGVCGPFSGPDGFLDTEIEDRPSFRHLTRFEADFSDRCGDFRHDVTTGEEDNDGKPEGKIIYSLSPCRREELIS